MKKLVLISSYCDNAEKIEALTNNLNTLKRFDVDVLLLSPISMPIDVIGLCDYYFETKENPVLHWPEKAISGWFDLAYGDQIFRLTRTIPDYGWAGLYQTKILSKLGLMLDYDQYYHIIYDLIIDETVIEQLQSTELTKTKSIYPSQLNDNVWEAGLHFMIFDKANLATFASYITKENYLSNQDNDAFSWLVELKKHFDYDSETSPVRDSITIYTTDLFEFYDYSPVPGLRLFISKNMKDYTNVQLLIYKIDHTIKSVSYDGKPINLFEPIDLGFNGQSVKTTRIKINDTEYDITKTIEEIEHNNLFLL